MPFSIAQLARLGIIAKVKAADFNALGQVVIEKIRAVKGVIDTKTLICIKF